MTVLGLTCCHYFLYLLSPSAACCNGVSSGKE